MLSGMMRHQLGEGGVGEIFLKTCSVALYNFLIGNEEQEKIAQNMLNKTMQFLVEKSAVTTQLRKKCSVAWCNINLGKEEAKKICVNYAQ